MRRILFSVFVFFLTFVFLLGSSVAEASFSIEAAEQFSQAWNDYYFSHDIDLYCGYSLMENSSIIQRFSITYNSDGAEKQYSTDAIPSDASIFITYNPVDYYFGFCIFSDNMKSDIDKAVIYSDEKIINNAIIGCSHDGQDMWSITLGGDDVYDLYVQDEITIKLTVDGKNAFIDITKKDNQYLYDMVMSLLTASWYTDRNYKGYLSSDYMPDGYKAVNTVVPDKGTKYSFREDYDAIENAVQSMFYVEVYDEKSEMLGNASGFVSFDEHLFITNQHVINGASYLKIWDENDNMFVLDQVVASNKEYDVAILLFPEGKKYNSLKQNTDELKRGQPVVAIGSPRGLQGTVSEGIISGFQKMPDYGDLRLIQISAAISPGSSGGALFDDSGRVIGITSSGMQESQNLNFAVPIQVAKDLYQQWNKIDSVKLGTRRSWDLAGFASSKKIEVEFNKRSRVGTYDGELTDGVPNGQGTFQSDDELPSLHYEGEWKDGKVSGKGTLKDDGYVIHFKPKSTSSYERTGVFSGAVQDGIPSGKGSFTTQNSEGITWTYTGDFSNGTFNGHGETVWESNTGYHEVGNYSNGLYNPTWPELIVNLANRDECNVYISSERFLQDNSLIFTTYKEIDSSLVENAWKASSFINFPSLFCGKLIRQENVTVIQTYQETGYLRTVSFLLLENKDGVLFYGYIDGNCNLQANTVIDSIYLLPINNVTYLNNNNEKTKAIFCAYAKLTNKERKLAHSNTLSLPTVHYVEFNDELSVSYDIENSKDGSSMTYVELYIYAEDKYGNDLYKGKRYKVSFSNPIEPGYKVRTGSIKIPNRSKIAKVYCGVHKIVFADGTTMTIDNIDYTYCTFNNK